MDHKHFPMFGILFTAILASSGCGLAAPGPVLGAGSDGAFAGASAAKSSAGYRVTNTIQAKKWDRIERLSSLYAQFPAERAREGGKQTDAEIVKAFGTATPSSSDVLLHYANGWEKGKGVPVLLVHGAIVDATSSWVAPHGKKGLVDSLTAKGFRVFAVTFAHHHGDNTLQAEQLANAIARVREVTGAPKVDIIAHSKGTVAARALASGIKKPWMKGYQKDIRRMVLIGGPNLGMDYSFRHPLINYGLYPEQDDALRNAPMSWSKMIYMGRWVDTKGQTLATDAGDYFPGQSQMLYRWDKEYPLSVLEQDWYTTYNGGRGFVSESEGIDKAIAQGGHYIDQLRKNPLDKGIELAVLAGDRPTMANILNETTGPSDGIVFVKSATHTDDMVRGGAKLLAKKVLPYNHMDLIIEDEPKAWVADQLSRP